MRVPTPGSELWSPATLLLSAILFASGFAGLGYEILWSRMFTLGLGHEVPSLLAVLAAFFGGLALGAWFLDGPVSRSEHPGRWYTALELAMGLWAFASIALIPRLNQLALAWTGLEPTPVRQWLVAFTVPFVGLLPATLAMGGTLPAMDRLYCRWRRRGRSVGTLYAANTLGACAGTLATAHWLLPGLGFRGALVAMGAVNLLCAAGALLHPGVRGALAPEPTAPRPAVSTSMRLGIVLFATGLLGIGLEVMAIRVMGQILQNTAYSFASALSVYLLATAIGAALYQRFRGEVTAQLTARLLWSLGAACAIAVVVLGHSIGIYQWLCTLFSVEGRMVDSVTSECLLAAVVLGLPAALMGATFSHLAQAARGTSGGVGWALGVNTAGGALASLVFGVLLLPAIGARNTMLLIAAGYLLLIPPPWSRRGLAFSVCALILLVPFLPRGLELVGHPPRGSVVAYRDGVGAAVAVVADAAGRNQLKVNNRFYMGGVTGTFAQRRQGHIPLLLHPSPDSALFLGLGTGNTFAAARSHPGLRAEGIELLPEVVELLPFFAEATGGFAQGGDLTVHVSDARRYVRAADGRYDVIVADRYHPARDGSGALYTVEHFQAIARRLEDGGLFCQWLPLYQLDPDILKTIVRSFLPAFPQVQAHLVDMSAVQPALGLIGSREPIRIPPGWMQERVGDPALAELLRGLGLTSTVELLGGIVCTRDGLENFAGNGPLNTDDHPVVNFGAPSFVYGRPPPPGHVTLVTLLDFCRPLAGAVAGEIAQGEEFARRLQSAWRARDSCIEAGVRELEQREPDAIELYLRSLRESPDLHEGYVRLVDIALTRIRTANLPGARALLEQLVTLRPSLPEAPGILSRIR